MSDCTNTCLSDTASYFCGTHKWGYPCPYCELSDLRKRLEEAGKAEGEAIAAMQRWKDKAEATEKELKETQLQLMLEETDRKIWQQDCKAAEAKLSRYEGAVEVDDIYVCKLRYNVGGLTYTKGSIDVELPPEYIGQRVRCVVMKGEAE